MNKKIGIALGLLVALALALFLRSCHEKRAQPIESNTSQVQPVPTVVESSPTLPSPIQNPVLPPVPTPFAKPAKKAVALPPPAPLAPPPVEVHKELIPKNIEIVRVYYASMITGPSSSIEFDINGSGFTKEFEKMITVQSGQPHASVKNLALITPNQIHGTLAIDGESATMVAFPQVLIKGKVVFQAPEPFAVIRPGEVLNLIFTEMGENGRSGRFRVFTNLTTEMFSTFNVTVSTPSIVVTDLSPILPFIVDGTVNIGPAVGGAYDIDISLKGKSIWNKLGIIRVVKPNLGQSGLIQKVLTEDGFHRPGDKVHFTLQGSGFQPSDVNLIKVVVPGLEGIVSSFTHVSPGRMDLRFGLPPTAPVKSYGLKLTAGEEVLQDLPEAFRVVGNNWVRLLKVDPALPPGGKSTLYLLGRDLTKEYVSKIKIELDEPELKIGDFSLVNPDSASAPISAGSSVKPGDYWLKMTSGHQSVQPEFGSIIRVSSN